MRLTAVVCATVFLSLSCSAGPSGGTDSGDEESLVSDTLSEQAFQDDCPENEDIPVTSDDATTASDNALLLDNDTAEYPRVLEGPAIVLNDDPKVPLAAKGTLNTDVPTALRLTIASEEGSRSAELVGYRTDHAFPVLGLFPGIKNTISVEMKAEDGDYMSAGAAVTLDAPALPEDFPPIVLNAADPDGMEPGWTLLNISRSNGDAQTDDIYGCLLAAVDEKGRVGWYFKNDGNDCYDFGLLSDGRLMVQFMYRLIAADMLGAVSSSWHPEGHPSQDVSSVPVAVSIFHHAVSELPWGNFLALNIERRVIADWPTSETDPAAPTQETLVTGDEAVEFTKEGEVLRRWNLFDLLDVYRIGYTSIRMFRQWTHANALYYDESDDTIVLSLRNQSVVAKIGYADGQFRWLLGPHDNWGEPWAAYLLTPTGAPFTWNYYQHAAKRLPDGTILMFDNGAYRAFPYDEMFPATENRSRAAIFDVDGTAMTVSQVWEWGGSGNERIYAPYLGDAVLLPTTGNVLITFGGITTDADGVPTDDLLDCKVQARIIEVTRSGMPGKVVFDLSVADPGDDLKGWRVYRGERWPSLYGGVE